MPLTIPHIRFSHLVYASIGVSFLWPWNALLTASLLAKQKLDGHPLALANYSSSVMMVSTATSLIANMVLLYLPANYRRRVKNGELIILGCFALLGLLGGTLSGVSWFLLMLAVTAVSSFGCSLVQNGALAITQRIPGTSHALSIMVGQGIAGVVPPLIPMIIGNTNSKIMAVLTFLSVCILALIAYILFGAKQNAPYVELADSEMNNKFPEKEELLIAARGLWGPITTILLGFAVSLSYPVFANLVESNTISVQYYSPITHLIWNSGDLLGRVICLFPQTNIKSDKVMVTLSALRFLIIGFLLKLVHMGNPSDLIYLVTMLLFGITGGFLISNAISHAPSCVPHQLQPAAGEIISLAIAVGLAIGSAVAFITAAML